MSKIIEIKNMSFNYNSKVVYHDFSLEIESGTFTTIIGENGSGKSTLAKIIYGILNSKSYVKVDNMFINPKNIKQIRKEIGYVPENPSNLFTLNTVHDDMQLLLKSYGYSKNDADNKILEVSKILGIEKLLNIDSRKLSGGEKQLVSIAMALSHDSKIILLDEALSMLDSITREKIFKILQELNKRRTTIINITNNSEEILKGTHLLVLADAKIILYTPIKKAFESIDIFMKHNIKLPFVIELSAKLQYYKIIDKIYLDSQKLVDAIWK